MSRLSGWRQWLRVAGSPHAPATLTARHIYIIPTRYGVLFTVILLAMLTGSINYSLSLGFVVTFLLAGMGVVCMLHTWRNLAHLVVDFRQAAPVFAGSDAAFEITLKENRGRIRHSIIAYFDEDKPAFGDLSAFQENVLPVPVKSTRRGWLTPGRLTIYTEFPLGLLHAWSYVALDCRCLIYPHPASKSLPVPSAADQGTAGVLDARHGDDDFAGHRQYQTGDSPKRVDWKASSREQGMLTKQFQGEAQSSLWFDWFSVPEAEGEARIQQLTRWIMDAHAEQRAYGLRLPGEEFPPNTGTAHYHACLQALALMHV